MSSEEGPPGRLPPTSAAPKAATVCQFGGAQGRSRGGDLVNAAVVSSITVLSMLTVPQIIVNYSLINLF
jgi:hypothetical protein